ncbi:MAG: hypothetical protein L3K15_03725 [Thermoplasmata archaeon]|nr:hypothetical protein [Thermoplasmata archaeon]
MPSYSPVQPDATDNELLRFLEQQLVPALTHDRRTGLLRAVDRAIRARDPRRLASLPERSRRELLSVVEHRLGHGRNAPSPGVVVRLVTSVSPISPSEAGLGRLLATPAR